jgi:hypothetical protein
MAEVHPGFRKTYVAIMTALMPNMLRWFRRFDGTYPEGAVIESMPVDVTWRFEAQQDAMCATGIDITKDLVEAFITELLSEYHSLVVKKSMEGLIVLPDKALVFEEIYIDQKTFEPVVRFSIVYRTFPA